MHSLKQEVTSKILDSRRDLRPDLFEMKQYCSTWTLMKRCYQIVKNIGQGKVYHSTKKYSRLDPIIHLKSLQQFLYILRPHMIVNKPNRIKEVLRGSLPVSFAAIGTAINTPGINAIMVCQ